MALRQVSLADKYQMAEGQIFLTGVQALVRLPLLQRVLDRAAGLNTAGYVTGYPGSPLASYDMQLRQAQSVLKEGGIRFEPALNEDLAMTAIWGTQQGEVRGDSRYDGVFAMWYGKGAGLDRSGDALRHGNLAGASTHGGVLLLLGDDHRAESSSVAHYSEYTMVDYMAPVLNPANVADILEFGLYGFALSRFAGVWVGLKCVHDVVESAGSIPITSRPRSYARPADAAVPPDGLNLRLPDTPLAQEFRLHNFRLDAARAFVRANPIDKPIWRRPDSRFGIVTVGKSHLEVMEALTDLGIDEKRAAELGVAIYKVGMSWPLEPTGATTFADGLDTIFVVEEKRSLIEAQLKEILYHRARRPEIIGKRDAQDAKILPSTGILSSNQVALEIGRRLAARPGGDAIATRLARIEQREKSKVMPFALTERKPTFCSGCPHNRSTVVPEGSRAGAGTGCGFMSIWMDRRTEGFTQMGADGVSWIGESAFSKRKHVFQNMGDGTYRHSGILAIRACVAAQVNITFKLLFNGVVAMTGGQPHQIAVTPAGIAKQVLAEGVQRCVVVTDDVEKDFGEPLPSNVPVRPRTELDAVQRELREIEGVTVLIYDQMCATEKRRQRKRGLMPDPTKRVFINHLVCEGCGDCGVKSNCVSILPRETELGRKREIDQHTCNKDYSCVEGFCPSFVTVDGATLRKPEVKVIEPSNTPLPLPSAVKLDRQANIVLSGVGGTGVITLAAVLGMAAHLEGKGVATLDMMGLAQKGGAVTSYLRIAPDPSGVGAARVPAGGADLLLGFDLLAAVGTEPMSTIGQQTIILANTNELMPPEFTSDRDLQFPKRLARNRLEAAAGEGNVMYVDANARAATAVGDTIAANTYMLGIAFQRGLIPLSVEAIERAFELNGVEVELNKRAFRAGREAVVSGFQEVVGTEGETPPMPLDTLIERRSSFLREYQNDAYAQRYRDFVDRIRKAEGQLPGEPMLTRAVAENLFKLMAYKDEYEIARLYTSGEFEADLRSRFGGDFRMTFLLAPPLLARRDASTGEPRKMTFGPWMMSVFRLLSRLRGLRGTWLDPFGHTEERRIERGLVDHYQAVITKALDRLDGSNREVVLALASLPQDIRGFGHVKKEAVSRARAREAELLAMLDQRRDASRAGAAATGDTARSATVR